MEIVVSITITFDNKTHSTIKEAKHKNTFITRAELVSYYQQSDCKPVTKLSPE